MAYLTARSLRGLGADVATATGTAAATATGAAPPAQPSPAASPIDDFEQTINRAAVAATSWWDAMPEYKRHAIVTGATSALVFYWASRILGSVFGNR